jgi:integrase
VNYELAALRRAFRLAIEKGVLATMPFIKLPRVRNARSGFFEDGDFAALVLELPPTLVPLIRFLRLTGWRRGEALGLTWDQIDWEAEVIRLASTDTKGGEPRVFPFGLAPELKTLLEAQRAARDGLFVFHKNGQPIGGQALRFGWQRATKRASLTGRLVHDLRRSAARDLRRAGVSEGVIMKLCGWRTRSMFDRYNVIDEQDLARAVSHRFGKHPANIPAPAGQPEHVD